MAGVGAEGEAQGVRATLWDATGVVRLLAVFGLLHLQGIQVTVLELVMETLRTARARAEMRERCIWSEKEREGGQKGQGFQEMFRHSPY